MSAAFPPSDHDVLVVGGGPAGATAATFLARGGLSVGLPEREPGVLAGGGFVSMPLRMRLSLTLFFAIVSANRWRRRRGGRTSESRLEW